MKRFNAPDSYNHLHLSLFREDFSEVAALTAGPEEKEPDCPGMRVPLWLCMVEVGPPAESTLVTTCPGCHRDVPGRRPRQAFMAWLGGARAWGMACCWPAWRP